MDIKRRIFLLFTSMLGFSTYLGARTAAQDEKKFKEVEEIIYEVQKHMFPRSSKLPAAEDLPVISFLYETMVHKSFDKDIRKFVLEGAKELQYRTRGKFITMNISNKEKALRAYEETSYGSAWLSRIMTLTMEGMFSDPIYGTNIQERGWKTLTSFGGEPRPRKRYLDV